MKVDCFIFYNEVELLEYRLELLYPVMDKFVIVESTHTFTSKPKPLYFKENIHLFEKYMDKILYLVYESKCDSNPWQNEEGQRNYIMNGLKQLNLQDSDTVYVSDLDEIPDPDFVKSKSITGIYLLNQDLYYYNIYCKAKNTFTNGTVFNWGSRGEHTIESLMKNIDKPRIQEKSGWHFSYFGPIDFIVNKIKNFSHQEFNSEKYTNSETIRKLVENCKDLFFREGCHEFYHQELESNPYPPKNHEKLLKITKL